MSIKIGRGAVAALAAGAMAVTLGSAASADVIDEDNPIISVPVAKVGSATLHRIADADRIRTAVKASQSANWGSVHTVYKNEWSCEGNYPQNTWDGASTKQATGTKIMVPVYVGKGKWIAVECTSVVASETSYGRMDIIVARADDYPDALAAATLADVLDAPILLHPTNLVDNDSRPDHTSMGLHPAVEAEIARLAGKVDKGQVTVHVLGGTGAISHDVENAIDAIPGVDRTFRYQGVNRYDTATNIANVTVGAYGIESGASLRDVNVYLTTGENFPDALSAGAAAAENDGVVLLTKGEGWDQDGFTRGFLDRLRDWVNDDAWWIRNTSEIFAVGGPAVRAASGSDGVDLAAGYSGVNRYETAELVARGTFDDPSHFGIVSGEIFADAVIGSGFMANADGPLLLTENDSLNEYTASYLRDNEEGYVPPQPNVDNGDTIVVFGGGQSVSMNVSNQVKALLDELFASPTW